MDSGIAPLLAESEYSRGEWPTTIARTNLGVPLAVGTEMIGMIGVANRAADYDAEHERLLATFANQVAVVIANARFSER